MMNTTYETPHQLWDLAIMELKRANVDQKHAFRRSVLATSNKEGQPQVRTVVNRSFNEDHHFLFYTDSRTLKVSEIQSNHQVSLLFYDPPKKLQIRIIGKAYLHHEGKPYDDHLAKAKNNPQDYQTELSPGEKIKSRSSIKYVDKLHFALLEIAPIEWDILLLRKEGHLRIFKESVESDPIWLIP